MSRRYIRDPYKFIVDEQNILKGIRGTYANIAIPNNVEIIGSQLFSRERKLESVIIPNSVLTIDAEAFYECVNLESVVLSNRLRVIGHFAFHECEKLEQITFFEGLKEIGSGAFSGCALSNVTIPSSVESIASDSFDCDSLINIEVDENNQWYKSIEGNLYSKDGRTLIRYAMGKNEESFTIPNAVTEIGREAFACCNLSTIILSDNITDIDAEAFCRCRNLKKLEIPHSVSNIGKCILHRSDSVELVVDPQNKYYKVKNGELFTTKWGGLTKVPLTFNEH